MSQKEYTGYISKSGKNGWYEILIRKTYNDVRRVKLRSVGRKPAVEFWVDEDRLSELSAPVRRPGQKTQKCWECGCEFTYWECIYNDGDWKEGYCGC